MSDYFFSETGCLLPVLSLLEAELNALRAAGDTHSGKAKPKRQQSVKPIHSEQSQKIAKLIKAISQLPNGKYPAKPAIEEIVRIGASVLGRYKIKLSDLCEDFVRPGVFVSEFYGKRQLYYRLAERAIWSAPGKPKKSLTELCTFCGVKPAALAPQTWVVVDV